ncbi:hypothetical protein XELAEV_18046715mg [Xenopus laevis]|uniref:Uncharacterized protein n=1 Tax=Xenopus laevis TaxID=8355 RepID=A0A974H0U9_XENLA|nr:hypothetical protein XELAEV_18046715mg [Xenopus laevis]
MATSSLLCSEYLRCPVCLDLFQEPVTIPCGHSFCLGCITQCWSLQGSSTSCPQCRCPFRTDSPPRLCKNSILSQIVDDFSNPRESSKITPASSKPYWNIIEDLEISHPPITQEEDHSRAFSDSISTPPMSRRNPEHPNRWTSMIRIRREANKGFSDMVPILQASGFRLLQLLEQSESEMLEQEDSHVLKQDESQVEEKEDTNTMEQGLTMTVLPSAQVLQGRGRVKHERDPMGMALSEAMAKFKESLLELCAGHMRRLVQQVQSTQTNSPTKAPEDWGSPLIPLIPRVRAEFLKYSRDITLDPNTAHHNLSLMQGNRRVFCKLQPQGYPDNPGRFNHYTQVLGQEPLGQGQHYWEVQLSGNRVSLGVSYRSIYRKGHQSHCLAGRNSHSWCLEWTNTRCYAWHDGQRVLVATGQQECLGVFVDWDRGCLSFHEVSEDMPVLYRFRATFIEPVYPIFFISWNSIVSIGEAAQSRQCAQSKRFQRQLSANF